MTVATLPDLLNEVRDQFLQMRTVSGGYAQAIEVIRLSIESVWPKLGRIRRERLPGIIRRRVMIATKRAGDLTMLFPPDLTNSLRVHLSPLMAVVADRRPLIREWRARLPAAERTLIEEYYRQLSTERGPVGDIAEFTRLHLELLNRLDRDFPVANVRPCETCEPDVARLVLLRALGDCAEDRRVILETLLIGETGNQQFFVRLMNVVAELEWQIGPKPDWAAMTPPVPAPLRERMVTWAFLLGCATALGSVIYAMTR